MDLIAIIALALAVPILLFILLHVFIILALATKEEGLKRKFGEEGVLRSSMGANLFGTTEKGVTQIRGNGVLILTGKAIHFEMLIPQRRLDIPRKHITGTSTSLSFMGKTKAQKLLKIDYQKDEGSFSAAWLVKDPDAWIMDIQAMTIPR